MLDVQMDAYEQCSFLTLINTFIVDIKDFRKKNNLTQSELAKIAGVGIRAVQTWEQGKRNISQSALKLLEAYSKDSSIVKCRTPYLEEDLVNARDVKKLRKILNLTQKELADKIGVSVNTIQNYENGGVIPVSKLQLLESLEDSVLLDVGAEKIKIYKDDITKEKETEREEQTVPYGGDKSRRSIRYWTDVDVTGGGTELFEDTLTENYEDMVIPEFRDCTDAVNLYGDSMSPRYNPGQIVILKEWKDSFIAFGQVYLVVTKSGFRTVKYLRKGDKAGEVLCVSENPKYDPFPILLDDILKMYLVKGVIEKTTL